MKTTVSGSPQEACMELRSAISASGLPNRIIAHAEAALENILDPMQLFMPNVSVELELSFDVNLVFNLKISPE